MDTSYASQNKPASASIEETLTDAIRRGEEVFNQNWSKVEDKIRESPTKAVLIAAGIGFALHRLPIGSLVWSHVKLLWALAPPAFMAAAAGKGLCALQEKIHQNDGGLAASRNGANSFVGAP
jgi:hypothetical protein